MPQDDGGRVRAGAPVAHVIAVMQRGSGRVQRLDQAGQRPPVPGGPARDAPGTVAPQLQRAQRLQRHGLPREQPGASVELAGPERQTPARGHDTGGDDVGGNGVRGERLRHAVVSASSVSMATRCACSWVIERFSLVARSRPDRWM